MEAVQKKSLPTWIGAGCIVGVLAIRCIHDVYGLDLLNDIVSN